MKTQKYLLSTIAIVFISLTYIIACGGGSSTGPDPDPPTPPDPDPSGITFNSGTISSGGTFTFTFDTAGAADYICTFHTSMQGSVTVQDGASTADVTVNIENMTFTPSDITIGPGTKVTWVNNDGVSHTATSQ